MTVPYSFANATVSIPLSQLDANFNTPITLGNTAIQLGNTVTTLNNMTLANVTISSGNVTITNVSVTTANVTTLNAATVIATTANVTTANITTGNVTTANIVTANITTGNVTNMSSGNVAITGGSINGTTLGASTASTANVTTLTTSSTVTINGGTANGVAYLNGSKVLTTGSALSFDGTRFGVNGGLVADNNLVAQINSPASSAKFMGFNRDGGYGLLIGYDLGGVDYATIRTVGNYPISFGINNAEAMRLTSTGLGIGTSSPSAKLQVYDAGNSFSAVFGAVGGSQVVTIGNSGKGASIQGFSNSAFAAYADLVLQPDGKNLGLGVTPSAWNITALQVKNGSMYGAGSTEAGWYSNAYYDSGWKYISNGASAGYVQNGNHQWFVAPSGTAGNAISFTQAMTLDASGNLGLGATSISPLGTSYTTQAVQGANGAGFRLYQSTNERGRFYADSTAAFVQSVTSIPLVFSTDNTERARITSGGDLWVGTTSGGSTKFVVLSTTAAQTSLIQNNSATPYGETIFFGTAAPNNTSQWFLYCYDSSAVRAEIRSNGGIANYQANNVNLSDRREKTNFAPAKSYLDTICAIPVQTFNYIDQSENDPGLTLGVVAQDVQAVAPELVMESNWASRDEEPKMRLSIYQTDLQYALMKCIQELKAQNDDLRARVAQLEAK